MRLSHVAEDQDLAEFCRAERQPRLIVDRRRQRAGGRQPRNDGSTMPQRFQRSRRKGARLPAGVVVVTRPTKWGNPHPLSLGRAEAVRRYRADLLAGRLTITVEDVKRELRGHDLAFYCPLAEHCHADVLLAIANE
jgi:hypothetical protein